MNISTVVPQKYFNGVAKPEEKEEYLQLVKEYFKEVGMVAFGQIKFILQNFPQSDNNYYLRTIDNLVGFAKAGNLKLHYNTVINNKNSFPKWYWKLSTSEKMIFLKNHIKTVIGKYKNSFYLFKLVNECVRDDDNNFLGTTENKAKLITEIFKWAKEESPHSQFMINDFGSFFNEEIRKKYIELIRKVKDLGGPIDFVGEQGHIWGFELPEDEIITNTLGELRESTSLPIHITEFDLSYDDTLYGGHKIDPFKKFTDKSKKQFKNWYEYQGYAYNHFYEICSNSKSVTSLTFWGFADEDVLWERPGIGLFDNKLKPKPSYESLKEFL